MGNTSRPDFLSRRACLYAGAALALGTALSLHRESTEAAESAEPIRPASAGVWRSTIDLNFSEPGGLAQWWVPELVLLGNTDVSLSARGPTEWSRDGEFLTYHDQKTDGRRDIFRMSLVKGQKQIERTPRHQQKWGSPSASVTTASSASYRRIVQPSLQHTGDQRITDRRISSEPSHASTRTHSSARLRPVSRGRVTVVSYFPPEILTMPGKKPRQS